MMISTYYFVNDFGPLRLNVRLATSSANHVRMITDHVITIVNQIPKTNGEDRTTARLSWMVQSREPAEESVCDFLSFS